MSLSEGAKRFPELVARAARHDRARPRATRSSRSTRRAGAAARSSTCRATPRPSQPISLTAIQQAAGRTLNWRTLIVLEEGAEAEVWERYLSADEADDGPLQRRHRADRRPGREPALRLRPGPLPRAPGSSPASAPRSSATATSSGSRSASAPPTARSGWRPSSPAAAPAPGSPAPTSSNGRQHLDYDTTQEHAAEDTTSDLAFRGVLDGRSTAVWRGMINVDKGAQRTDAFQDCRNLLLSKRGPCRRDPGPADRGRRRRLHARGGDRPDRPRAALLPDLARPRSRAVRAS